MNRKKSIGLAQNVPLTPIFKALCAHTVRASRGRLGYRAMTSRRDVAVCLSVCLKGRCR